jgi:hypothetical protein
VDPPREIGERRVELVADVFSCEERRLGERRGRGGGVCDLHPRTRELRRGDFFSPPPPKLITDSAWPRHV